MNGKSYDNIGVYLEHKNKHFKIYLKGYESNFNDYRDEDEEEKRK